MEKLNLDTPIYIFDVKPLEEGEFELDTENHDLGISAEYAWINYKYPRYKRTEQSLDFIRLNGENVECDILTIENKKDKKHIFFDISDFFSNPLNAFPELCKDDKTSEEDDPSFEITLHKKND
jgi:hypothetical protein